MTEIRIPVPRMPDGLVGNLVGVAGLIGVAVAVGGLTGVWWWSLLVGSLSAVGLSYVSAAHAAAEASPAVAPAAGRSASDPPARPPVAAVRSA